MSEYQYYEFQAIDRPLDNEAREALRNITSRAEITATSLINEYHYGSFKGNPEKLMEQYFDAFLYFANWGSRTLMLRVPLAGLTEDEAEPYCRLEDDGFSTWATKEHLILAWESRNEDGGEYYDDDEHEGGALASLIPLREELMRGDRRPLYLGWLLAAHQGYYDDEEILEPPVPPGLKTLTAAQSALAEFLEIDEDLIAAAAERSADLGKAADPGEERDQAAWVNALPAGEKDAFLLRLLRGEGQHLAVELRRRFRDEQLATRKKGQPAKKEEPAAQPRSIAELRARADALAEEREERQRRKKERERQETQRLLAEKHAKHLDSLAGKEEGLWKKADELVSAKLAAQYDEAVTLLKDLRDLAERAGTLPAFTTRLKALREKHSTKRSFHDRLNKVGLA